MRDYETITPERIEGGELPLYTLTPERIRYLPQEEVVRREREAEDDRAAHYRAMYDDLGLRVVAYPDDTLEVSWRFLGRPCCKIFSDTSKNKHASRHFHSTGHPIIRSFQPGEDWRWCYVDEVLV